MKAEENKAWIEGVVTGVMNHSKGIPSDFISNLGKAGYNIVKAESENEIINAQHLLLEIIGLTYNDKTLLKRDISAVQSYARIQIEKDMERIKYLLIEHLSTHVSGNITCCLNSINETPIILDL